MLKDRPILLLALGETLVWACLFYIFPALLLHWEQYLGWSKTDLAAAITIAILVSGLAAPIAGRLIDRGYGPVLMAGSSCAGGLCLIALASLTTLWQFYSVWTLIGLALAGCLYDPCFSLVTRARGARAKRAIITITLAAGFASTLSYPTAYLLAETFGWRITCLAFAAIVLLVATPCLWRGASQLEISRTPPPPRTQSHSTHRAKTFLRRPVFWFLAFGFASLAIAQVATIQHIMPLLNATGLSAAQAVFLATCIGPMQVLGRVVMLALERHLSNHTLTLGAIGALALSLAALLFSPASPLLLAAFVILFGSGIGTISILRPLITRDLLGESNFGAKSGALALVFLAAAAAAPSFAAVIWSKGGSDLVLQTLLATLAAGTFLYLTAHHLHTKS